MESAGQENLGVNKVEKWEYKNYLREYLLLVARKGRIALESREKFPKKIELSKDWHKALEDIRQATKDGKERWTLVGVREDRDSLYLPTIPVVGCEDYVPGEVMARKINLARDKFGIVDLVGTVHSHPGGSTQGFWRKLPIISTLEMRARFSAGDYYGMVVPGQTSSFMGVVEGDYNLFVFRTKQTRDLPVHRDAFSQESFEKYWYEKFGYRYIGNIEKNGAQRVIPISDAADPIGMNKAIAEKHKLVLYQGVAGKELVRIYPK